MSMDPQQPTDANASATTSGETTADSIPPSTQTDTITALTIVKFLFGNRNAIETVAASPAATWLAFGFVICAGFFREYDQEYLLHAPWYLFIPLVASTGLALLLLGFMMLCTNAGNVNRQLNKEVYAFVRCFWMCAPMAMLYAIPVEQMYEPFEAMKMNVFFLKVVSIWRVVLISRILSVMYPVTFWQALFPVMVLADSLVLFAMTKLEVPLIGFMGGIIQLTETEKFLRDLRSTVNGYGYLTWPFWFIGSFVRNRKSQHLPIPTNSPNERPASPVGVSAWLWLGVSFIMVLAGAAKMQPKLGREVQYQSMFHAGEFQVAINYASGFESTSFPTYWNPPPKLRDYERTSDLYKVLNLLGEEENSHVPQWFLDLYARKLLEQLDSELEVHHFFWSLTEEEVKSVIRFLKQNPQWIAKFAPTNSVICTFIEEYLREQDSEYPPKNTISLQTLQQLNDLLPPGRRCDNIKAFWKDRLD